MASTALATLLNFFSLATAAILSLWTAVALFFIQQQLHQWPLFRPYWGGRKGGPKTAKPHRNIPKNRKPHRIFSWIPKPHVHGGPPYETWRQQDLWYILITILFVNIKHTINANGILYYTIILYLLLTICQVCGSCTWSSADTSLDFEKPCHWSCTSCIGWLITLDDAVLVVEHGINVSSGIVTFLSLKEFTFSGGDDC